MSLGYFCISNWRIQGHTIETVTIGVENGDVCQVVKDSINDFKFPCLVFFDEFNIFQENRSPLCCCIKILTSDGSFFSATHQFKSTEVGVGISLDLTSTRKISKHKLTISCAWVPLTNTLEYSRVSLSSQVTRNNCFSMSS